MSCQKVREKLSSLKKFQSFQVFCDYTAQASIWVTLLLDEIETCARVSQFEECCSFICVCSRQQSQSSQLPLAIQATWGSISRRKTALELFPDFWNPSWKEKRNAESLYSLTTTTTRAFRSEKWVATKPSTNRQHSRTSRFEQWAVIGKGEEAELFLLTSKLFFIRKTSISILSKLPKRSYIAQN